LVVGKPLGVYGGSRLMARFTRASLTPGLRWGDVFTVGLLAGIDFTVSLLIGELAFYEDAERTVQAKSGVLAASVLAAVLAAGALLRRSKAYRDLEAAEEEEEAEAQAEAHPT
jgi:NhaA family Na+:H+ antiporter